MHQGMMNAIQFSSGIWNFACLDACVGIYTYIFIFLALMLSSEYPRRGEFLQGPTQIPQTSPKKKKTLDTTQHPRQQKPRCNIMKK